MVSRFPVVCFYILLILFAYPLLSKNRQYLPANNYNSMPSADDLSRTLVNIGNISCWLYNDGQSAIDPTGNAGVIYPRGTAGVIYEDGLVWGARVPGDNGATEIRVGGATYRTGTRALSTRIYRIRRDWRMLTTRAVVREAAEFFQVEAGGVSGEQARYILEQYKEDWKEWPVEQGAPWVDKDGDGVYNPVTDENGLPDARKGDYPGIIGADQVIWYKMDDQDAGKTTNLYGSKPLGLEIDVTVWGVKQPESPLGQAVFKKYKIRNISDTVFQEMYLSQWADPNIGSNSDDLVGCDSTLQYAFAYNSGDRDMAFDKFNIKSPAMAYVLLQGPVVPSEGDSAFYNGALLKNFKNLPMTSFGYFSSGNSEWTDPEPGLYKGTLQWYNLLRGYISTADVDNPTPFTHRATGRATRFPLNGDPVTGEGDVDGRGNNFRASARRMLLATGPFSLNPGEEQEMVVALVGGLGDDSTSSVETLRKNIKTIRSLYGRDMRFPGITYVPDFPDNEHTGAFFTVDLTDFENVDSCNIVLRERDTGRYAFSVSLFDDGAHGDGSAGDGIWANRPQFRNRSGALVADVEVFFSGRKERYPRMLGEVRLRPLPELKNMRIVWEDGLQDGKLNREEHIHLRFDVANRDDINAIHNLEIVKKRHIPVEGGLGVQESKNEEPFFFALKEETSGDTMTFFYEINFDGFREIASSRLAVEDAKTGEYYRDTLNVVPVKGTASQIVLTVADPSQLSGHDYAIVFTKDGQTGEMHWKLWDETLKQLKLENGEISSEPFYPYPVVDGIVFKIGDIRPGIDDNDPWGADEQRWISGYNWGGAYFSGGLDIGKNFFGSTITDPSEYRDIVIYWAADTLNDPLTTDVATMVAASREQFPGRWSRGQTYRRDQDYAAAGTGDIPFAVYDVGQDPPRRLNICFVEDANYGSANLLWDMGWNNGSFSSQGGQESLFIMSSDYNEGLDYDDNPWGPASDVMYVLWPRGRYGKAYLDAPFTMYINGADMHMAGDSLVFKSPLDDGDGTGQVPETFYVKQNYPNPFNPVTRIRFGLSRNERVRLEVFNLLGQQVRTLVNAGMARGNYTVEWDGRNDQGRLLSSGVYIYKLTAGEFSRSRKMILLK